jgi:Repeat of unknown function (DUF5650)/Secretion system C-terminal sorting domain
MKPRLLLAILFAASFIFTQAQTTNITGPVGSGQFGKTVTVLTNGNYVVTDPSYDEGGITDIGAVYLYNGLTHALISTLKGSHANDQVGSGNSGSVAIFDLTNGNYVVISPNWDNGTIVNTGAVTWCNGITGINGVVSSSNSLVGTTANDIVGNTNIPVTELTNGNYLVLSTNWDNGTISNAGAVTWGSGTTGVRGAVSSTNSLVGSKLNDKVGSTSIKVLSNGNYVVVSSNWDNATVSDAGAVTWGSGTTGVSGIISSSNSLVGSTANDQVGGSVLNIPIIELTNGNYVVRSIVWDNGTIANAGAVTWCNGITGRSGVIGSSNSLVGTVANDQVGLTGVTVLNNGNFVIRSSNWNNAAIVKAGAVTWVNGTTGISGTINSSNSLVGSTANDQLGLNGITVLKNDNYVIRSSQWDNASVVDAGAATWASGAAGISGTISISNSLIGSKASDQVGGVTALSNGHYVVVSPLWNNGTIVDAGAATWANGTTGISGTISSSNSLVGSVSGDLVGNGGVAALTNGNFVVASVSWDNGTITDAGAATWVNGTTGMSGVISSSNSLVGSTAGDSTGYLNTTALTNGNYVVSSINWDNGTIVNAGAVTWGNGTTGTSGVINSSNSLVGNTADDQVGIDGISALSSGNYVVITELWNNGAIADAGAVTWANGTTGISGSINSTNSLVGTAAADKIGLAGVRFFKNGNYQVLSYLWDNGSIADAGASTWGSGTTGISGAVSSSNSLVGSTAGDNVGSFGIISFANINRYAILSYGWDNGSIVDAGAETWGNTATGIKGVVSTCNSALGNISSGLSNYPEYNGFYDYLIAGKYSENRLVIFNPAGQSLGIHLDNVTQTIAGISPTPFLNSSCRIIASVLPTGTSTAVNGSITAKEWVETTQPATYVKRHYEITPASNASTATGKVTLYFTQQEFTDFNAVNTVKLPTGTADAAGKANLRINKYPGTSSDGSGSPASYTGTAVLIDPADADITWNTIQSRWEVSFDVTGFSGFFAEAVSSPLPLKLLSFTGSRQSDKNHLQWKTTDEINTKEFSLERSTDGRSFSSITMVTAAGTGNGNYSYDDAYTATGKVYYRLQMIDNDGRFTYSNIIVLNKDAVTGVTVYPNPIKNTATLYVSDRKLLGTAATITDVNGRAVQQLALRNHFETIDMAALPPGIYLLRLADGQTQKLVKE